MNNVKTNKIHFIHLSLLLLYLLHCECVTEHYILLIKHRTSYYIIIRTIFSIFITIFFFYYYLLLYIIYARTYLNIFYMHCKTYTFITKICVSLSCLQCIPTAYYYYYYYSIPKHKKTILL